MPRCALLAVCADVTALAAPHKAEAIPRYSAAMARTAASAITTPPRGAMRSLYARKYLVPAEMASRAIRTEALDAIQPNVTESITVGTDVRGIHHWATEDRKCLVMRLDEVQRITVELIAKAGE